MKSILRIAVFLLPLMAGCIFDSDDDNTPPVIVSVTESTLSEPANGKYILTCIASDKDRDDITYRWNAPFGNIEGGGPTVTWNAPKITGPYTISCLVTDDRGGMDSTSVIISVSGLIFDYSIANAWWTDEMDSDKDGYAASRTLNFDVNVEHRTQTVYAVIEYMPAGDTEWQPYLTTPSFPITASDYHDAYAVTIGSPNQELESGVYCFRICVFLAGDDTAVLATRASYDDEQLNTVLFESSGNDAGVLTVLWTNDVDNDADGYTSARTLNLELDMTSASQSAYATIEYRLFGSDEWQPYKTTDTFLTRDGEGADCSVVIGSPNDELDTGGYEFRIRVYSAGGALLATRELTAASDKTAKLFEPSGAEKTYTVYSAWWSDLIDNDGDGNYSSGILHIDVNVSEGTEMVYVTINSDSSHPVITKSENSTITGSNTNDACAIVYDSGMVEISIYLSGFDHTLLIKLESKHIQGLGLRKHFESKPQDSRLKVTRTWFSDIVDVDNDGDMSSVVYNVEYGAIEGYELPVTITVQYYINLEQGVGGAARLLNSTTEHFLLYNGATYSVRLEPPINTYTRCNLSCRVLVSADDWYINSSGSGWFEPSLSDQ